MSTLRRIVRQADIDRYAEVSGDHNPLHVDAEFAASTSFGRTIAHGQLLVGLVGAALADRWGPRWDVDGTIEVKFVAPVYVDDAVDVVLEPEPAATGQAVTVRVAVGDRTVVVGRATYESEAA